mgnify:CR=1 FL=1
MKKKSTKNGFSLIELLVVATIIIVLTTIGVISYRAASIKSRDSKRKADLETVRQALVLYRSDEGSYPTGYNFDGVVSYLNTEGYLSDGVERFRDPGNNVYVYSSTVSTFTLSVNLEDPNATNPYTLSNP